MPVSKFEIGRLYAQLSGLVEGKLWVRVLFGLVLGAVVGAILGAPFGWLSPRIAKALTSWIALPGDVFIRLVQMVMIPLVVASIVSGIAGEGAGGTAVRLGARVGAYFIATTAIAIIVGLVLALAIRPGEGISLVSVGDAVAPRQTTVGLAELPSVISGLLPTNPLASVLAGEMLSIVIFAIIIGMALTSMPAKRAEPMLELTFSVQEICMTVTKWVMKIAPLAVFGLMARTTATSGLGVLAGLGFYVLTVLLALLVLLVLYAAIVAVTAKISLRRFFEGSRDTLLLAFSMASSAAVMPLSMKTAENELKVPPSIARFVVPLGAIVNMNGTAAYQGVATVFLAQAYGLEFGYPTLALVLVTTVAASVGTPSAPGAGIVILAGVLASAGVPAEGISVIIGVDHLLGMFRTAVNVAGDLTACTVFASATTDSDSH